MKKKYWHIFQFHAENIHNPSGRTMALGLTQPLQKWVPGVFPGGKGSRCIRLTTLPPSCAVVKKYGNLNFLKTSGPLQACNGTALPLPLPFFAENISLVCPCGLYHRSAKGKGKAVCGSYSTAALRRIVLLPEWVPSFISRGAAHTKRRERPLLAKEGTIPGI